MLKLVLKILLFQLVKVMPAYEIFSTRRNTIGLDLISNISEKKKFLGINWFNEYQKTQFALNSTGPIYKPLMRIIAVTDKEIYFKKFSQSWFDLDPLDPINLEIHPHFVTTANNPITAYHMDNNQSILTIALRDLTIITLNASQAIDPKKPQFKPIMKFNSSYKFVEGTEQIRSIAQVPYTNQIIFSSNRFEIFKMSKLTKEVIYRGRSPLDSTNFIVTPVPTHRPEYDPHNPNKKEDSRLSKRVVPFTETTYFVMTSADSGINSLVDWTLMKTIRFFSMRDRMQKNEDEGINYKVRSICFFGGSPRANLYVFAGSNVTDSLSLFSAINRNIIGSFDLPQSSESTSLSWVNHTNYIYILQTGIRGEPQYISGSYFLHLGPDTDYSARYTKSKRKEDARNYLNPTMLAFNMNITSDEVYDEIFDRLDYFYLFLSSSENSIRIDIPSFNWDRCNSSYHSDDNHKMYYGRYRNCGNEGCLSGYQNRPRFDYEKNDTAIQCQKITCKDDLVMHVAKHDFDGFVDKSFPRFDQDDPQVHWTSEDGRTNFTKVGKNLRMSKKNHNFYCLEKYKFTENEKGVANDNGCSSGFNLDPSGVCRSCDKIDYTGIDFKYYPSDCFLWILIDGILDDTLTFSWYHYNKTKIDKNLYYKGFNGSEFFYRLVFYEIKDTDGKVLREIRDAVQYLGEINIRQSTTYIMPKRCYWLTWNPTKNPKYDLKAAKGYSLSFISRDPTGQAVSQIGKYGDNSPLNTFYCRKTCLQGYYYDFDSISCRRCNFGCAVCTKFEECELCQAGFNKVKKPKYFIHDVEEDRIGHCQLGCQNGFYLNAFDGECLECDSRCLKCMDSVFVLKEKYDEKNDHPSHCLDCHQESTAVGLKAIINMTTGVCQLGCDENESNGSITIGITREYCHVCGEGCQACEIPETSNCISCSKNFYFQRESKKCLRLTETWGFWIAVISICLFFLLLCCLVVGVYISRLLTGGINFKKAKKVKQEDEKSLFENLAKDKSQKKLSRKEAVAKMVKGIKKRITKEVMAEIVSKPEGDRDTEDRLRHSKQTIRTPRVFGRENLKNILKFDSMDKRDLNQSQSSSSDSPQLQRIPSGIFNEYTFHLK